MLGRMPACPVCGTENPDVARFCLACGAALTAEPLREERKVVTVLFADLVGFTSRAEQLDPEDVRAVLAPYWERLRGELERRGGTVEKFIGDAVMALFGAPLAHDDDPLRAVGAALAIRDWAREEGDVQVRIAVNTGEALVVLGARPTEGEGMAAGDVVNTTARLQTAAPVNGVLVGETTYRATRDVVEYAEHEPVAAKGKAEPIPVWEAVQARSRLGMDVERATLPLVGRQRELGVIVDAFERAKSEREPQLVTLVGVPGIGKSRLVGEFFSRLEGQPDLVWWRQGRALPYGEGVSFWALAEMVKAQAGIQENDARDAAESKLRESVARLVDEDEREWVLEHLLPLVGGEQRGGSGESAPAWRRFFEGMAEQRPLVMVFEDMHWADDGLLDFIDHLVDWASGVPILVLATARPELLDRRQAWGGGKLNVSTIALTPLSDDEAAQIIHGVLEQAALPAETQQALLERAGGNPLYAEQFARLYMERGSAEDLPLPETVQGLIAARLDGLTGEEKRLIQDAAVFGKVFWAGAVDADENALHSLERNGMLRRERRSAVAGETQYAFRHVLVRDVAYGQIPRAARGEKHVRAADWIESLGRAEDHGELLAHHLAAASELGLDVGERLRRALWTAARKALALHAYGAALEYSRRALALWPEDGPERAYLLADRARAEAVVEAESSRLGEAIDALEDAGDSEAAADLAAFAANVLWNANRRPEAERLVAHGEQLLAGRAPSPALCAVLAEKARLSSFVDDPDVAEATALEALALAERFQLAELHASSLNTLANVLFIRGEYERAGELNEEALAAAPPASRQVLRALVNRSLAALAAASGVETRAWLERALDAAQRVGDLGMQIWINAGYLYETYYKLGRWDEALERLAAVLRDVERAGGNYMEPNFHVERAEILAARGRASEAHSELERVMAVLDTNRDIQFQASLLHFSAPVYLLLGDLDRARELIERLLTVDPREARGDFAPPFTAGTAVAIAKCGLADRFLARYANARGHRRLEAARLVWTGRAAEAAELYADAAPQEEATARLFAAEQLAAAGHAAEAAVQLERGLAFFRAVGATKVVADASAALAAAAAAE
jgi:class 3 adenylate cyclase/tetratricopeptide (TPR) repeat protein